MVVDRRDHLMGNCIGVVTAGSIVHQRGGPFALWGIFLFGGAGAVLDPLGLSTLQWTHTLRESLAPQWLVESTTAESGWVSTVGEWWTEQAIKVGGMVAPQIAAQSSAIGSSGGVSALAGAGTAVLLEELIGTGKAFWIEYSSRHRAHELRCHASNAVWLGVKLAGLLSVNVSTELAELHSGHNWRVSHGGHLSGFLCGFAGMTIGLIALPVVTRSSISPPSSGRRLGQH